MDKILLKLSICLTLLLMLGGVVLLPGCSRLSSKSTNELLNEGTDLATAGKWKKAMEYANAALKKEPNNVSAQLFYAFVCENNNKPAEALEAARKAVAIDPQNFLAQFTLGRLYAADPRKTQDAIEPLLQANRLNPGFSPAVLLLAESYRQMNHPAAVASYNNLIKYHTAFMANKSNAAMVWNQLATIYVGKNEIRQAALCLKEAYTLAPDNPHIILNFAIFLERIGQSSRAVSFYQKYLELTAKNAELAQRRTQIQQRIPRLSGPR